MSQSKAGARAKDHSRTSAYPVGVEAQEDGERHVLLVLVRESSCHDLHGGRGARMTAGAPWKPAQRGRPTLRASCHLETQRSRGVGRASSTERPLAPGADSEDWQQPIPGTTGRYGGVVFSLQLRSLERIRSSVPSGTISRARMMLSGVSRVCQIAPIELLAAQLHGRLIVPIFLWWWW